MKMKRRAPPNSLQRKPNKKFKKSKKFWQQRQTANVAPVPESSSDEEEADVKEDVDEEEEESNYDKMVNVFASAAASNKFDKAIESESEKSDEEEDDDENAVQKGDDEVEDDDYDADDDDGEEESEGEDAENGSEEEDGDDEDVEDEGNESDVEEEEEVGDEEREEPSDAEEEEELSEGEELLGEQEMGIKSKDAPESDLTGGPKDPFTARVELELPAAMRQAVDDRRYSVERLSWRALGNMISQTPQWDDTTVSSTRTKTKSKLVTLDDNAGESGADGGKAMKKYLEVCTRKLQVMKEKSLENAYVKMQLSRNVAAANVEHLKSSSSVKGLPLTSFQTELFSVMNSYRDLLYCERTHENGEEIRFAYTLHALNHVLKTRTKILLNNARLAKARESKTQTTSVNLRDQGLCRPKVVIVVPFRESARRIVKIIQKLLFADDKDAKANIFHRGRFEDEFSGPEAPDRRTKPDDYYETFAGNIDDGFKLGLAVAKKALKLYTDFYTSDIILCSPLGLRMIVGAEGDAKEARDFDFLNSIELLVLDQADVFTMQNWEHVTHVMAHLHLQPTRARGTTDFSRVRMWALSDQSRYYRQTLIFSSCHMPELNAVASKLCHNYAGRVRVDNPVAVGEVSHVMVRVPMVFHRFDASSVSSAPADRFDFFTQRVMPEFSADTMYHTCIVVPSYFDYVRLRNWMKATDRDFAAVCEYTKDGRVAAARDLFFHGDKHFLLYTERIHFYRRFALKGIRHLVFYQLPQTPGFFSELCNLMQAAFQNRKDGGSEGNMSCTVVYSKYDKARLDNVVGSERSARMITADKAVHMFVAGS